MRIAHLVPGGAIAAIVVSLTGASPAAAQVYPWCAVYARGETNCGFETFAQCEAARSGNGGYCYVNPAFGYGAYAYGRRPPPYYPHYRRGY